VKTICRAGHATDDNMAHAHCMLDTLATNTQFSLRQAVKFETQHCVFVSIIFSSLYGRKVESRSTPSYKTYQLAKSIFLLQIPINPGSLQKL